MGGEVVLSRWCQHLSGARYWINGDDFTSIWGEWGKEVRSVRFPPSPRSRTKVAILVLSYHAFKLQYILMGKG